MPEATFKKYADEIKVVMESEPNGPDRVVGVMYGALVENQLSAAIKITLKDDKKIWNELFNVSAPIGAFGAKLRLSYMLGIIEKPEFADIERILKIRNELAHKVQVSSFDDQPVTDWISVFSTNPSYHELYSQAVAKYGNEAHPMVYNGIVIRKNSKRALFQWAAKHYFDRLSIYEINTFMTKRFGDTYPMKEMPKPSI